MVPQPGRAPPKKAASSVPEDGSQLNEQSGLHLERAVSPTARAPLSPPPAIPLPPTPGQIRQERRSTEAEVSSPAAGTSEERSSVEAAPPLPPGRPPLPPVPSTAAPALPPGRPPVPAGYAAEHDSPGKVRRGSTHDEGSPPPRPRRAPPVAVSHAPAAADIEQPASPSSATSASPPLRPSRASLPPESSGFEDYAAFSTFTLEEPSRRDSLAKESEPPLPPVPVPVSKSSLPPEPTTSHSYTEQTAGQAESRPTPVQLLEYSSRIGAQVFARARSKAKDANTRFTNEDPALAYVNAVLAEVTDASPPDGVRFGWPIYVAQGDKEKGARATLGEETQISVGDIFVAVDAKFKKGLAGSSHSVGSAGRPHIAIVADDFDVKKHKVRVYCVLAGGKGKVVEDGYHLDHLRAGEVRVYRVLPRV
jgi:hypothetical protein